MLKRSTPEKQGIDSKAILNFIHEIESLDLELHSFMILRHGYVISEAWWKPYKKDEVHMLNSLSKSFTSTAIGLAVGEGLITLNDRVISFFEEYVPDRVHKNLDQMTIRHLLTMNTGHDKDFMMDIINRHEQDWVQCFFQEEVIHEPGTHFVYNNMATYMLSAIIQKVAKITIEDYLKSRIFEVLGIECTWAKCPKGINFGAFGLNLTTESIAKFGQLYLQNGLWDGRQIIPAEWIKEATTYQVKTDRDGDGDRSVGYGYQFWRCRHNAYRGDGAFGQYCIVMPDQDAVIAITSGVDNMQAVLDAVWKHLLTGMVDGVIQEKDAYNMMQQKIENLAYTLEGNTSSPWKDTINGNTYKLESNDYGIKNVTFTFQDDYIELRVNVVDKEFIVPIGISNWIDGTVDGEYGFKEKIRSMARWQRPDVLKILYRFVEATYTFEYITYFEEGSISIDFMIYHGFQAPDKPVRLIGKRVSS